MLWRTRCKEKARRTDAHRRDFCRRVGSKRGYFEVLFGTFGSALSRLDVRYAFRQLAWKYLARKRDERALPCDLRYVRRDYRSRCEGLEKGFARRRRFDFAILRFLLSAAFEQYFKRYRRERLCDCFGGSGRLLFPDKGGRR